jgi:hypothetical protein
MHNIHPLAASTIEALQQFTHGPVWDGNLISKSQRDCFKACGWVDQRAGFNFLTATGVSICATLNLLRNDQQRAEAVRDLRNILNPTAD